MRGFDCSQAVTVKITLSSVIQCRCADTKIGYMQSGTVSDIPPFFFSFSFFFLFLFSFFNNLHL